MLEPEMASDSYKMPKQFTPVFTLQDACADALVSKIKMDKVGWWLKPNEAGRYFLISVHKT